MAIDESSATPVNTTKTPDVPGGETDQGEIVAVPLSVGGPLARLCRRTVAPGVEGRAAQRSDTSRQLAGKRTQRRRHPAASYGRERVTDQGDRWRVACLRLAATRTSTVILTPDLASRCMLEDGAHQPILRVLQDRIVWRRSAFHTHPLVRTARHVDDRMPV